MNPTDAHALALSSSAKAANLLDNTQGQLTIDHIEQAAKEVVTAFCCLSNLLVRIHGGQHETLSIEDTNTMRQKLLPL